MFAKVDDEYYESLIKHKWCAHKSKNGRVNYADTVIRIGKGKNTSRGMHQIIMGDNPLKLQIDHIDGDGLNNQRSNLRFCTNAENCRNQKPTIGTFSIYRGVCFDKKRKRWEAQIIKDWKRVHHRTFKNELDAAKQYDIWAKELFGEFARLNFPD